MTEPKREKNDLFSRAVRRWTKKKRKEEEEEKKKNIGECWTSSNSLLPLNHCFWKREHQSLFKRNSQINSKRLYCVLILLRDLTNSSVCHPSGYKFICRVASCSPLLILWPGTKGKTRRHIASAPVRNRVRKRLAIDLDPGQTLNDSQW